MKQMNILKRGALSFTLLITLGSIAYADSLLDKLPPQSDQKIIQPISGKITRENPLSLRSTQMYFLENKGQIKDQQDQLRTDIAFLLKGAKLDLFIGNGELHYQWTEMDEQYRMDVSLIGSNKKAKMLAEQPIAYYEKHYLSGFKNKGITAYAFQKITYKEVYPHIDWVLYIKSDPNNPSTSIMEYDFIVRPGGKVSDIQIAYDGAIDISLDRKGRLTAKTPLGSVTENAPFSFQSDGQKVASNFVLKDNILRFATGSYKGTLTIDPLLSWGTYYGGSMGDLAYGTTTDKWGNVYLSGQTNSTSNMATTGAHQTIHQGSSDAFLVKFDSSGIRKWATYYGGSSAEEGWGLACDEMGNIYMAGLTQSANLPVTAGAHQSTLGGESDVMLVKFDSSGSRIWATYYGGAGNDVVRDMAYDGSGYLYFTGSTTSANGIATTGVHQERKTPFVGISNDEVYLVKFDTSGKRIWGTYFGGDLTEQSSSVVCEKGGNIYIAGLTQSDTGIATIGSHQITKPGYRNGFIAKFNPNGKRIWGTYYGGDEATSVASLSLDHAGSLYIGGYTNSENTGNAIATLGALKIDPSSGPKGAIETGFLARFDTSGIRKWGTYFGGLSDVTTLVLGVSCDGFGDVFIAGMTESDHDIATPKSYQDTITGTNGLFLVKFDNMGKRLWGSYYGGEGDGLNRLVCDGLGSIYIAGTTAGTSKIPTPNGFQTVAGSQWTQDAYLVRFIEECPKLILKTIEGNNNICPASLTTFSIPKVIGATSYVWTLPAGWTGSSMTDSITVFSGNTGGVITVKAISNCDTSATQSFSVSVYPIEALITVNAFQLSTSVTYLTYQWLLNGNLINGATSRTYNILENGRYAVVVSDEQGCMDTSDIYEVTNYGVGIKNKQELSQQIKIYPNPVHDIIHVAAPIPVDLKIMSQVGGVIQEVKNTSSISVKKLASGIYLLHVSDRNGRLLKIEKISKE